jgi:two-component sensor histidine kinase
VADDGVGYAPSTHPEKQTGFGCTLIQALSDQLGGTLRMDGSKGLRVELEFPV